MLRITKVYLLYATWNNEIINQCDYEIIEEDYEDRLLDGHSEIKALDKESSKFARHLSKII